MNTLERLKELDMSEEFSPKQIGAIVGAYTGFLCGSFADCHEYIEQLVGRPVWTHEIGDTDFMAKVQELAKPDFLKLGEYCKGAAQKTIV